MPSKINGRMLALQMAVAVTAVLFILYGVYREEVSLVLAKAINICFECIGLG
ncbi:MAG: CD1871A family CXXC motif-containing protein [Aristaeellaceae bacterium]